MADFEAIVVGSGCAGSVAAYELAKAGKSVLVIERGNYAGAKNVSGGRIYTHSLARVFPDFEQEAPLERRIAHERISLMAPDGNFTIDFSSQDLLSSGQDSYSVLRGRFDQWLASKAEDAGAEYICGIAVEELLKDGNRIVGVSAGGDEISADVVILADGANSLLAQSAVGAAKPTTSQMAVGIKQVIELPEKVISDRLLCNPGEGAAWLFAGDATHGTVGGGFMYTNRESISLGLVATMSELMRGTTPIPQMFEDFKNSPSVAPLIRDGKVVEHSGHMVSEGGYDMMPALIGDGVLLAGDSAMMCLNLGYTVRGMDLAIAAGQEAGLAAAKALDAGDTSAAGLACYRTALEDSFVLKSMRAYSKFPHFMESTPRVFTAYPKMIKEMMTSLFLVDGTDPVPLRKKLTGAAKKVGYLQLARDGMKGVKAL